MNDIILSLPLDASYWLWRWWRRTWCGVVVIRRLKLGLWQVWELGHRTRRLDRVLRWILIRCGAGHRILPARKRIISLLLSTPLHNPSRHQLYLLDNHLRPFCRTCHRHLYSDILSPRHPPYKGSHNMCSDDSRPLSFLFFQPKIIPVFRYITFFGI